MKATDLRIGNWVLIPTSMDGIIIPSFPKKVKGIGIFGGIDFTEPEYPENHIVPAVHCAGIPLTEEWLLKLGFKEDKIRSQFFKSCGEYIMKISVNVFSGILKKESSWFVSILAGYGSQPVTLVKQYVHQIQNLYFELDKELKIK